MDEELREELRKLTEKRKALLEREKAKGGALRRYFTKSNTIELLCSIVFGVVGSLLCLKLCGII